MFKGGDFWEEPEFDENESATRKGEEWQDAEDNTNHVDEDTVKEPDIRDPSRTREPPKHIENYVIVDDAEAVSTATDFKHWEEIKGLWDGLSWINWS